MLTEHLTKASHSFGFAYDELMQALPLAVVTGDKDLVVTVEQYADRSRRMGAQCKEIAEAWSNPKPASDAGREFERVVLVAERNVHGSMMLYPMSQAAHTFAEVLGMKTIPLHKLAGIKALGYVVRVVGQDARDL